MRCARWERERYSSLCCPKSRALTGKHGKDHPTLRVDHPEERTPRRTAMALVTMATCNRLSNAVSPPENSPTPVASSCLPAPFASDNSRSRRRQHQVRLPTTRSTRYTRSFFFHSALLWNTLPNSIQSHSSTSSFQHALEEHWHAYKYLTDTDIPLPPV